MRVLVTEVLRVIGKEAESLGESRGQGTGGHKEMEEQSP